MRTFEFTRADSAAAAIQAHLAGRNVPSGQTEQPTQYLAGGTTLLDLMKIDVMRPSRVIDINALQHEGLGRIEFTDGALRLGAMARMSDVADHPDIKRNFPIIAQSLQLAASAQLRNMASLGGNVLQRTRCSYFRDTSYPECNKRSPGSGCAAMEGINRKHAVLGVSDKCIATYPGDFGQALIALDAEVEIRGPDGERRISFARLHRVPGETPHIETALNPGELIAAFHIPRTSFARRSIYLKIRDRQSYEFALASAAVALGIEDGKVQDARIALGGVATVPWRAHDAEARLKGQTLDDESARAAADAAFAQAQARDHNAFKIELGRRTLIRALRQAAAMEI